MADISLQVVAARIASSRWSEVELWPAATPVTMAAFTDSPNVVVDIAKGGFTQLFLDIVPPDPLGGVTGLDLKLMWKNETPTNLQEDVFSDAAGIRTHVLKINRWGAADLATPMSVPIPVRGKSFYVQGKTTGSDGAFQIKVRGERL